MSGPLPKGRAEPGSGTVRTSFLVKHCHGNPYQQCGRRNAHLLPGVRVSLLLLVPIECESFAFYCMYFISMNVSHETSDQSSTPPHNATHPRQSTFQRKDELP